MSKFLIIPQINNIDESLKLAEKYGFGFEFNDFFFPDVLDDKSRTDELIEKYKACGLPEYCTMHGAFFDVLIFSDDREIRRISEMRIRQSLDIARRLEVKGVVFHTNHTPHITTKLYLNNWLDRNEDFWRRILAEYPDVRVYMENMFDDSPRLLSLLASRMADVSSFGVCFDYAHAVIFGSDIDWQKSGAHKLIIHNQPRGSAVAVRERVNAHKFRVSPCSKFNWINADSVLEFVIKILNL